MKFLSDIGHFFKKVFANPKAIALEASIADLVLPGFAPLINSAASAIISAETSAAAAGLQNGTGPQKLETAIALFQSTYNTWASQNGLAQEPAAVKNILQNVFNLLNDLKTTTVIQGPVNTPAPAPGTPLSGVPVPLATGPAATPLI